MTHRYYEDRARGIRNRKFSAMDDLTVDKMGYLAEWRAAFELGIWGAEARAIDGKDRGYDLRLRGRRLEVKWVSYESLKSIVIAEPRPTADIIVVVFGKVPETLRVEGWLTVAEVRAFAWITHRNGVRLPGPGGYDVPTARLHSMRELRRLPE